MADAPIPLKFPDVIFA